MYRSAREASGELLKKKNVQLISLGHKRIKGRRTSDAAAVIYVLKKENVAAPDRIPETISIVANRRKTATLKTDVVELIDVPKTFGVRSGNVLVASNRHNGVCGLSFTKNGAGYVLTNAHVGCDIAHGGSPGNLSLLDPGSNQLSLIGPVVWSSGLSPNTVAYSDAAVARADYLPVDPYQIFNIQQQISGTSHFVQDNTTYWFTWNGVEYECAHPEQVVHPANIDVEGVTVQYDNFWILQMTRGTAAPGQSGALICRTDNGSTVIGCGLIFGGSAPNLIFAFSFDELFGQVYTALPVN